MIARLAGAALLAVAVFAAHGANGQALDLSAISCKQFIELPKDTAAAITLWLDGHLTDEEDPAVLDLERIKAKAERLAAFCAQNPQVGLMTAAEDVMGK
jgi:acid stress chaperone HdeB